MIERIEHLTPLRLLKRLDLGANRIRVISGLKGLFNLEYLNLQGNKIVSIRNLIDISGEGYKIRELILTGNNLRELKELTILEKMPNLRKVDFNLNREETNPFCAIKNEYLKAILMLKNVNSLIVDKKTVEDITDHQNIDKNDIQDQESMINVDDETYNSQIRRVSEPKIRNKNMRNSSRQNSKNNSRRSSNSRDLKNKQNLQQSKTISKKKKTAHKNVVPSPSMNYQPNENENRQDQYYNHSSPSQNYYEELGLFKGKLREKSLENEALNKEKISLGCKLENNEKYWIHKVKSLESNYIGLKEKLQGALLQLNSSKDSMSLLNEENKRVSYSFLYDFLLIVKCACSRIQY